MQSFSLSICNRHSSFEFYYTAYNKKSWRKNSWTPIIIFTISNNGYRVCCMYVVLHVCVHIHISCVWWCYGLKSRILLILGKLYYGLLIYFLSPYTFLWKLTYQTSVQTISTVSYVMTLLCNNSGCPGTPLVDQADLQLTEICLLLLPECWD